MLQGISWSHEGAKKVPLLPPPPMMHNWPGVLWDGVFFHLPLKPQGWAIAGDGTLDRVQ